MSRSNDIIPAPEPDVGVWVRGLRRRGIDDEDIVELARMCDVIAKDRLDWRQRVEAWLRENTEH